MIKMRRYVSVAVIVISILSIILGIVFVAVSNGDHTSGSGLVRASTSIEFGGDYYTSSAQNSALAANAATDIYTIISLGFGFFFILSGSILLVLGLFSLHSVTASGNLLFVNFKSLGDMVGKTYEEITRVVGIENAVSTTVNDAGEVVKIRQWITTGYHISLLFDSNDNFICISSETWVK